MFFAEGRYMCSSKDNDNVSATSNPATNLPVAEVEEIVKSRLKGRVWSFRLIVESQGLILRGTTRTYHAKQLAQEAVLDLTDGRPVLANQIVVC